MVPRVRCAPAVVRAIRDIAVVTWARVFTKLPSCISPFCVEEMLRVGPDCSGLDTPLFALRSLGVPHEHVCVETIRANHAPRVLYGDPDSDTPDGDITRRDPARTPPCDLYVCGAPCQPYSRGSLFFFQTALRPRHMARRKKPSSPPRMTLVRVPLDHLRDPAKWGMRKAVPSKTRPKKRSATQLRKSHATRRALPAAHLPLPRAGESFEAYTTRVLVENRVPANSPDANGVLARAAQYYASETRRV